MALTSSPVSLRRVRWGARTPRAVVGGTCAVLCALGLRSLLATPTAPPVIAASRGPAPSLPAQAFAQAFARVYLTWDPRQPGGREEVLRRFAPGLADPSGPDPVRSHQRVTWSAVASDRPVAGGRRVVVLLDTTHGRTALAVTVRSGTHGALAVSELPALVAWPATTRDLPASQRDPVDDEELAATITRALGNYLGARRGPLAADLLPGSVVAVPDRAARLLDIEGVDWVRRDREVVVALSAGLDGGQALPLAYRVGVAREAGRWFVRWIGTDQSQDNGSAS